MSVECLSQTLFQPLYPFWQQQQAALPLTGNHKLKTWLMGTERTFWMEHIKVSVEQTSLIEYPFADVPQSTRKQPT